MEQPKNIYPWSMDMDDGVESTWGSEGCWVERDKQGKIRATLVA